MNPIARTLGVTAATNKNEITLSIGGKNISLTQTLHQIWTLCDGSRDIDAIAHSLALPRQDIFAALDQLADFGLLQTRPAPPANTLAQTLPAGMNRREALSRIALGVAGGFTALTLGSRAAFAQDLDKSTSATDAETTKDDKVTDIEGDNPDAEIAKLDKRIQERDYKRKQALECRAKIGDKRTQEEQIKFDACKNPGQLQKEISSLKKQRRLQEQKKKTAHQQESSYKRK
jgi:hypothetical protein